MIDSDVVFMLFAFGVIVFSTVIIPIMLCRHWRNARELERRRVVGGCPGCGYDLRASSGRCPECGALKGPTITAYSAPVEPPATAGRDRWRIRLVAFVVLANSILLAFVGAGIGHSQYCPTSLPVLLTALSVTMFFGSIVALLDSVFRQ